MYNYYGGGEHFLRMFLMIYFLIIIALLVAGIVKYVLKSIGMYRIARNRNMDNAWLAWVPYARTYLQGELSGPVSAGKHKVKNPGLWMILIPIISGAFVAIIYVFVIFAVVTGEIYYYNGIVELFSGLFIFVVAAGGLLAAVAAVLIKILRVFVNRQIFAGLTSESMALFHAVASAFIPLYEDICFFVLRDKGILADPGYAQNYAENYEQNYAQSYGYKYGQNPYQGKCEVQDMQRRPNPQEEIASPVNEGEAETKPAVEAADLKVDTEQNTEKTEE